MRKAQIWFDKDVELLEKFYSEKTNKELADMFDGRFTVVQIQARAGHFGLLKNRDIIAKANGEWSFEDTNIIRENFSIKSNQEIYDMLDGRRSIMAIEGHGKKFGLIKNSDTLSRVQKEVSLLLDNRRRYPLNKEYFLTQSNNMAYILGLLSADGNLKILKAGQKVVSIAFKDEDRYMLEKISREVGMEGHKIYYNEKTNSNNFEICCSEIYDQVLSYGLTPRKSLTLRYNWKLKEEFLPDYIRGVFDGDGCFCINKAGHAYFYICTASKGFAEDVLKILKSFGLNNVYLYEQKNDQYNNMYRVGVGNFEDIRVLYDILYKNSNDFYLIRKRDKFEKYFELKKERAPIWTEDKIIILKENFENMDNKELVAIMGDRFNGYKINHMAKKLRIKKSREYIYETRRKNYDNMKISKDGTFAKNQ